MSAERRVGGRLFQSLEAAKKKNLLAAEARDLWFILCSTRRVVLFDDGISAIGN